ncbi:hypothetical protein GUJ93_ZPchr0013g35538 [Zizania palustris]|uniref:Uncharacterized protein n=1 Tax=Zizania palustris TaxID=103762 RepID=A0A8J5X165_ZIZPA|nr:hypothetical protein GUJ93_ZPchr0013g35538 [Zizania palustris]
MANISALCASPLDQPATCSACGAACRRPSVEIAVVSRRRANLRAFAFAGGGRLHAMETAIVVQGCNFSR